MFSYTFYKLIHLSSIFMILISLGAIAAHCLQGGTKSNFKGRKFFMIINGIGLLFAFIAGFGLIAKAGYNFSNAWIWGKLAIWVLLGGLPVLFYKKGRSLMPSVVLLALVFLAIYLVEYQPHL